jgi:intracellular multiplication protein IcmC
MKNIKRLQYHLIGLMTLLVACPAWADGYQNPAASATQMISSIGHMASIAQILSIIAGIGLFFTSLFEFKRYGEMRTQMSQQMHIGRPLAIMLAGIMLLTLPLMIGTFLLAIWGDASPLAYTDTASSAYSPFVPVVINFVRLVGIFAFMRGIFMLSRMGNQGGQQGGGLGKALIHMMGGVLCINVVATHQLLSSMLPV